ncbi:MAG: RNA-binding S4 domain-containing protein [Burkholderiaceae bacterium]|nr:RNA-binding S4 domain-containing protein [Burkholderiaceae bacterium]
MQRLRIDKWLWAARFYKTRSLAAQALDNHRIQVNGETAKAAREIKPGDTVTLRQGPTVRTIAVRALSAQRGSAPIAQQLYQETPESLAAQASAREWRRLAGADPAQAIEQGRPTKRQRRQLDTARNSWGARWSASIDQDKR